MTEEQKAAKKQELLALGKERIDREKAIYEARGLQYPPPCNGNRDGWRPPELKELEREIALKLKAIVEKYGE